MATNARPGGISLGPLLAAGGAILLFVSMFLDYLAEEGEGLNAWKTFVFYDIVLIFCVVIALAAAAALLLRFPGLPVDPAEVLKVTGLIALVIIAFGVLDWRDIGAGVG